MEIGIETNFDSILEKLVNRFESNPYSLSPSELQMLKWFSQNPGYLEKPKIDKKADLIKTSLFSTFIKKNLESD